ncbi:MAG: hypothetical protein K2X72_19760 [Reyranella sp.]|nr:hypothetical protein [Reyranella sp.]
MTLTAAKAAERVDGILMPLHGRRVMELGVDPSGLFDHYKAILDGGHIANRRGVSDLAHVIGQSLPRFDAYHVLRSGLGELAFVLSAMGLRVLACEANTQRFAAVEAGVQALEREAPEIAQQIAALHEAVPSAPPGDNVLCIAHHLMGFSADQEDAVLALLSRYDAVLIEPRLFLHLRPTIAEQDEAVEAIRRRGFTFIREFSGLGVVYCAKPTVAPMPTMTVRSELPAVTNIVDALTAMPIEETGHHHVRLGAVSIRDYPFPFAGALAIACGVAWQSRAHFQQLRDFLCGDGETPFGHGLGLEVGGAFTFSRDSGRVACFGVGVAAAPAAAGSDEALLVELGRAGWVDTLRDVVIDDAVRRKLEALASAGFEPTVGVDVGGDLASLRFTSDRQLLERTKFGEHVNFGSEPRLVEAIQSYPWEQWQHVFPASQERLIRCFNSVLQSDRFGEDARPFKRFSGSMRPTWTNFPPEFRTDRLDALTNQRAAMIVELEASAWSLIGAAPFYDGRRQLELREMFDEHAVPCWQDIATRWRDRKLLLATAGRLLQWLWLRECLRLRTIRGADKWVVTVSAADERPIGAAELHGLALVVPEEAPEIVVELEGTSSPLPVRRAPDPAVAQHDAVYLPWSALTWPQR